MTLHTLPTDVRNRILAGAWAEVQSRVRSRQLAIPRYTFHGNNARFFEYRGAEVMLSGPSETGKTWTGLCLVDHLARTFPGLQGAIVRKTRADMDGTVLQLFNEHIKLPDVRAFGGEKVEWYGYPNGSRLWVGGMDKPGKVLSGARDLVFFNQAEEAEVGDWETLITRTTGRAGHLKDEQGIAFGMLMGDCNPGPPTHWIWSRQLGGQLKFFESRHRDNPRLYDQATGQVTEEGRRTLAKLDRLTGYRRLRLRDGLWVQAEGIVFDTWRDGGSDNDPGNVTEAAEYVEQGGPVYWSLDDGYSAGSAQGSHGVDPQTGQYVADAHPRAILLWQQKPDGHLDLFAESYHCLTLSDAHISEALALPYPAPEYCAHGPGQMEIRGRLMAANIAPRHCQAKVDESIKELQAWLAADTNGWRRIRVHPRCRHFRSEMLAYAYDPANPGKPLKQYDHGCLVAGTVVETSTGPVRIETIRPGDYVLTRRGYALVGASGVTDPQANIWRVEFSDGSTLEGTHDHPVFVEGKGFIPIDALRYGDRIVTPKEKESLWQPESARRYLNQFGSMGSSLGATLTRRIGLTGFITNRVRPMVNAGWSRITGSFIKSITDLFRQGAKFTTAMETRSTMIPLISNAWRPVSIPIGTGKSQRQPRNYSSFVPTWTRPGFLLPNGTAPKKVGPGTGSMASKPGSDGRNLNPSVKSAAVNLIPILRIAPSSARMRVNLEPAAASALTTRRASAKRVAETLPATATWLPGSAPVCVQRVYATGTRRAVYNLTVKPARGYQPEYFANGVLVHNCDSARYVSWTMRHQR